MGALQRHKAEQYCLDSKKTFFCVTLDRVNEFDVVSRPIQMTELFCTAGEIGDYWLSLYYQYKNSQTKIKLNG